MKATVALEIRSRQTIQTFTKCCEYEICSPCKHFWFSLCSQPCPKEDSARLCLCGSGRMLVASGCVVLLRPRTSGGSPLCFMLPPIAHLLLPALCHMYNMSHVLIFYSAVLDVWFR